VSIMPEEKIETKIEEKKEEAVPKVEQPVEAAKIDKKIEEKIEAAAEKMIKAPAKKTVKKAVEKPAEEGEYLVPIEEYLKAGIHIGSQFRTGDMKQYIYKTRQDGLHVLDIKTVDERLRLAAKFLSTYEPSKILVVAGRVYARTPARRFAENIGCLLSTKRFVPGTLTNPNNPNFVEPDVILVSDPGVDKQVVKEAKRIKVPVVALCDTNNLLKNIDVCVPVNNKGKKALALAYWLLARETLLARDVIKSQKEFTATVDDFESSTGK